jgi:NinB protein
VADQWKLLFMHACGQEVEFMPSLDGSTFIPYGGSSSEMKVDEMEFMTAWGVQNGVVFRDGAE